MSFNRIEASKPKKPKCREMIMPSEFLRILIMIFVAGISIVEVIISRINGKLIYINSLCPVCP